MTVKFPSGMRFAFRKSASPVAYCAIHIKAGTRFETSGCGGLAHFTEHLIFKGTQDKSAGVINSCIEKLGGELNAYTTKEEIVIHSTILKEDLSKAVSLLTELAFRCVFPEKEIEKEKDVVIEEIKSYKDSPADQIYDDFEEYVFKGTPLSMPVLGKVSALRRIGRDAVTGYYGRMFIPENMVFTIVADMEEERARGFVESALAKYLSDGKADERAAPAALLPLSFENQVFNIERIRRNHQSHCILGSRACSFYDSRRIPLILLANIIGGPASNSRLNLLLREKNALVYSVECNYSQFVDAGILTVYFGCDKTHIDKCEKLIYKVFAEAKDHLLSERALKEAKKQLLGQLAIAADSGEAQALSMGKSIMVFDRVIETEENMKNVEAVTAEQILEVAQDVLDRDKISRLLYI